MLACQKKRNKLLTRHVVTFQRKTTLSDHAAS